MKKIIALMAILFLIIVQTSLAQQSPRKIVRIDLKNHNRIDIENLHKLGLDILKLNEAEYAADVLVTESDISNIKKLGFETTILIADADKYAEELVASGYLSNFHSFQQMLQEMQEIVANNPQIAKLVDIGDSYEKQVGKGGFDIWVLKISDNVQIEEDEAEVFFFANIHARELITPEIIMYFMHHLVDNYGTDPYITHLINNRQIWLCPTMNPDGHEYCLTGSDPITTDYFANPIWWRKNKRDNDGDGIFNPEKDGVDLNRNFGYMWGFDNIGSSPEAMSAIYRGPEAFSEPESQAIRDFAIQHHFIVTLSFHSYGQLWLYPWGYTSDGTPDFFIFKRMADVCVSYNHYIPQSGYELYATNGNSDDWLYGEQTLKNKSYAFTVEVGSYLEGFYGFGFFPDTMYIEKQILENQQPMIYLTYTAGEEPIISHRKLTDTTEFYGPHRIVATMINPLTLTTTSPIDPSQVKLFYRINESAPFDSLVMTPTGIANQYNGDIPILTSEGTVYYYLSAKNQRGRTGTLPVGAPLASFSFYYRPDLTAPEIHHLPLDHGSISAMDFPIRASIIDNIKVDSVWIYYRKNYGAVDSLVMIPIANTNYYQASIPALDLQLGDYYEYQIIAVDNALPENKAQLPDTGYFNFYIRNSILFDFETDSSLIAMPGGNWQWGVPNSGPGVSYSGAKVWATNLNGNYSNLSKSILETPEIELSGQDSSRLIFWHWYEFEFSDNTFWDGGNVKISVDNEPIQILNPRDGYDGIIDNYAPFMAGESCFGGIASNGNFWHKEIFDLTPYLGHRVKIRFCFAADDYVTKPGWYIDLVEILLERITTVQNELFIAAPANFELGQNHPNPFNPTTEIKYCLPQSGMVKLEVFNLLGQQVITLVNEYQPAGNYRMTWEGSDPYKMQVPSGVYFYRLTVGAKNSQQSLIKKMVKLK